MTLKYLAVLIPVAMFGQHTDLPATAYPALDTAMSSFLTFQRASGAPSSKSCTVGKDVYTNTATGDMYVCTTTGTPGSWVQLALLSSNITGTATNVSGTPALPNGTSATTQSAADNSTNLATTAYVDAGLLLKSNLVSPSFTTPTLGVATATSVNKVAITAPATSATLTIANGKTLTVSNTLTFTGTDSSSVAFGAGGTAMYTGTSVLAAQMPALTGDVTTSAGAVASTLAAQYKKLSCQPGLGDGLNAITAGTYLESTCYNDTGVTVTITGIKCFTDNSGTSALSVTNGAATALLTGAITCSSSFAAGTQSATTTIASGDYIKFSFVADGTSKQTTWVVTETN